MAGILLQNGGVLNIAHRGASAYFPGNTMAAFKAAVRMNADMIELDIRLTKDGIPIAFHDSTLNAHTNAKGRIDRHTLKELKLLDAGSWFDPIYGDQKIVTLEETLDFARNTIVLNIEIKKDKNDRISQVVRPCLKLVKKYKMETNVLFSSFDERFLKQVKLINPALSTALLFTRSRFSQKKPSEMVKLCHADSFHCTYNQLTKRRASDLKAHQIPVAVYTINQSEQMKKLIEMGVNGIITDKPDLLQDVIERQKKSERYVKEN